MKKNKGVGYFVLLAFLFIGLINFASADVAISSPKTFGNYSTIMNISVIGSLPHSNSSTRVYNVSLYCNSSGGSVNSRTGADVTRVFTLWNATATSTYFDNGTVNISSLTDALKLYNCSAYADNGSAADVKWSAAVRNITIDDTVPNVSFSGQTNTINNGNYSGTIILNVSVVDATMGIDAVYFNITNTTGEQVAFSRATGSGGYYSLSLVTSTLTDGKFNITAYANDTQLNNLNKTEKIQITIENAVPTVTFSCSPSRTTVGSIVTCTCGGSSSSGVNTTTYTANPSTAAIGLHTETCTVVTSSGTSTSTTATYIIDYPPSEPAVPKITTDKINSWTKMTPGIAMIMKDFDKSFGVKQIQIEVNNEAQNVMITVTKYNSKPANVSIEKSDTYRYLSVNTKNLINSLNKATIELQVNKSWVSGKGLNKEYVSLFKYDEAGNKWNQLTTTFKEEDSMYYYYETEVTSFSYFAIAPKEQTPVTETSGKTILGEELESTSQIWIIILLIIILAGIIGAWFLLRKKKGKKK